MNAQTTVSALMPTLDVGEVAAIFRCTAETFLNKRAKLEEEGFPHRLPGTRLWSRAAVMRWITTNGDTPRIAAGDDPLASATIQLEADYADR